MSRTRTVSGTGPSLRIRSGTLADFDVSEDGMLARDQFVTDAIRERRLPMVVVTAGGYGPSAWRVHFNYYRWLLDGARR